jgi:hypothetical protein
MSWIQLHDHLGMKIGLSLPHVFKPLQLGVGACRLVGLDPDQLSLQAPFPEGLAAPMAGSPMARQLAPGGFMLHSGRPACGPVSLHAQESAALNSGLNRPFFSRAGRKTFSGSYSSGSDL